MGQERRERRVRLGGAALFAVCAGLAAVVGPFSACAETAAGQAARIQRRQALQRTLPTSPAPPDGREPAAPSVAATQPAGRCIDIRRIEVKGVHLLSARRMAGTVRPFEGRCLGLARINGVLQAITIAYVRRGYVAARAYLPEQDLSRGVLRVAVVEGRLAGIAVTGSPTAERSEGSTAFPGMVGRPLNLRDVEQGLEQMNRLPGVDARASIRAGEKPGESVLAVERKPGPFLYGDAGTDDLGAPSTGIYQDHFAIGLADLLGLNDRLDLGYQRSTSRSPLHLSDARPHGDGWTGSYELPWGYWTFAVSASALGYRSRLRAALGPIPTSGKTETVEFSARRVVARDQLSKTALGATLTWIDTGSRILGSLIDVASYRLAVLRLELAHDRRVWGGAGRIAIGWSRGLGIFGAGDDRGAPAGSPGARFGRFDLSASFARDFRAGKTTLGYEGSLSGQWSGDPLYSSEQMSVGGPGSVRGVRDAVLFGNRAAVLRQTLALPVASPEDLGPNGARLGSLEVYAGLDAGRVWGQSARGIAGGTMAGAAVGLRSRGGPVHFDLSYSRIVARSAGVPVDRNGLIAAGLSVAF